MENQKTLTYDEIVNLIEYGFNPVECANIIGNLIMKMIMMKI